MKVKWFSEAVKDLNQIYEYYETENIRAAARLYNTIVQETGKLKSNPYIAAVEQILEDCPEAYRSLVVAKGRYKVVYYIEGGVIYIVHIFAC